MNRLSFRLFVNIGLEKVMFCTAIMLSLYTWLKSVDFTPDSTNYIVAGKNLLLHQTFFVFTNWPSYSLDLQIEPFTDFPPGFSILFAGFLSITRNLYAAITISQSVYIALFYAAFANCFRVLKIQNGICILFWIIIPLFPPFIGIFQFYLSETAFIAISVFIASLCLSPSFNWRFNDYRLWLILILIGISSSIRFMGVLNCFWLLIPLWLSPQTRSVKLSFSALVVTTGVAVPILWFMRNHAQYGVATKSHAIGTTFLSENLMAPFNFLFYTPFGIVGNVLVVGSFLGIILCIQKLGAFIAQENSLTQNLNLVLVTYTTLVIALLTNFLFVVTASLFAHINALDGRLLSPSFSIALILIAFTLSYWYRTNLLFFWVTLLLFLFLLGINSNTKPSPELVKRRALMPAISEKALEHIFQHPLFINSSGFYTEYNFNYQLYTNLPHRMLWDTSAINTPDKIKLLFNKGNAVFFVFKQGSDHESIFVEQSASLPFICKSYFSGYTVFYQDTGCSFP